jgi:hypothetical protein
MRRIVGGLCIAAIGLGFSLTMTACGGNPNEQAVTKGTVAPDAPKSREEYYTKIQEQQEKTNKSRGAAK